MRKVKANSCFMSVLVVCAISFHFACVSNAAPTVSATPTPTPSCTPSSSSPESATSSVGETSAAASPKTWYCCKRTGSTAECPNSDGKCVGKFCLYTNSATVAGKECAEMYPATPNICPPPAKKGPCCWSASSCNKDSGSAVDLSGFGLGRAQDLCFIAKGFWCEACPK